MSLGRPTGLLSRVRHLERITSPGDATLGALVVPRDPVKAQQRIAEAQRLRSAPFVVVPEKAPVDPINERSSR